jgi:hypothetical protein
MNNLIIIILLQILGFAVIYIILKKMINNNQNQNAIIEKVKNELNSIMVEINQATEQNIGLIEDKINTISEILKNADKKINIMKRETEKHQVSSKIYDKILSNKKPVKLKKTEQIIKSNKKENNRNNEVYELFNEGFSSEIIAGKLGLTVGEVDLIISLRRRK